MCGLVGIVDGSLIGSACKELAVAMLDTIVHRGPDGRGAWASEGVGLAHARLAIVDLSANGAQPMESISGRSQAVFNGEIYNFRELRRELNQLGQDFRTQSDTEVIIAAFEQWGSSFVSRLNGIFAIAIYDVPNRELFLFRDRLGAKPLYYAFISGRFLFASEMKAVIKAMPVGVAIDRDAMAEYLAFQNLYSENTLLKHIKLLAPGSKLRFSLASGKAQVGTYWSPEIREQTSLNAEERLSQLRSTIQKAIGRQLQADVPVNSFLSGGIDSSAIAAVATEKVGRIKTFTCGFDLTNSTATEQLFDERRLAERVAFEINSEHYETVLKAGDLLEDMVEFSWHAEEPRVGSSLPTYFTSRLASRFTKVCLSGTGGDEAFGGYPWRYQAALTSRSRDEFAAKYFSFWHRMVKPELFSSLTSPLGSSFDPLEVFRNKLFAGSRPGEVQPPFINQALIFEITTFLHGLLIVEDKASMAHGLEVRVPLLDNEMIDLALSLPLEDKIATTMQPQESILAYGSGSGSAPSFTNGKIALRKALSSHVPNEVVQGRKQGFSPPFESWFRGPMRPYLDTHVFGSKSSLREYVDMDIARNIWEEHADKGINNRLFVWGMLALQLFLDHFMRRATE